MRACGLLDGLDRVRALLDTAEDRVLVVEPRARDGGDEELGAVGVRPRVRHRQAAGPRVLPGFPSERLVRKLGACARSRWGLSV